MRWSKKKKLGGAVDQSAWELESQYSRNLTIEQLVNASPFKIDPEDKDNTPAGTRIPLWMEREFRMIVERSGSPYQTKGEAYRDALYLGLKILNLRYSSEDWIIAHQLEKLSDDLSSYKMIAERVDRMTRSIDTLVRNGYTEKALSGIVTYLEIANGLENQFLRHVYLSKLLESSTVRGMLAQNNPKLLNSITDIVSNNRNLLKEGKRDKEG